MFVLHFDMRAPATGAPPADLYEAALEMAAWAETHGCVSALVSEHHATDDGYLPAPMVLASALAARTSKLPIMVAVAILPLHDPVRLAEEAVLLDVLSRGRVSIVAGLGYRPAEYEMFGVDFRSRGRIAEESLGILLKAKTGEPFEHRGRRIHVTPAPVTPGGPMVAWGGGSLAAVRRAGRHGIGFFGQRGGDDLRAAYEESARTAGHQPGMYFVLPEDAPTTVFVADDVDKAWEELGPYLMHDVLSYADWNEETPDSAHISPARTIEELRAEKRSHRILTVAEAVEQIRGGFPLPVHPLLSGMPPELAWRYLHIIADKVLPAVRANR